jgi:hypothetical protein
VRKKIWMALRKKMGMTARKNMCMSGRKMHILAVVAAISWLVPGCSPWWLPNPGWFQDDAGNRAGYCRDGRLICNGR